MEKFIRKDQAVYNLITSKGNWVLAPNTETVAKDKSNARHHGDFDNDADTLQATLARILGQKTDAFDDFTHFASPRSSRAKLMGMSVAAGDLRTKWNV
jgi:hypothetical protein